MLLGDDGKEISPAQVRALSVQYETLKTFKGRIDDLIASMDHGAAGPKNIGQDKLDAAHLGTGFPQAEALSAAYTHVHSQLESFSSLLSDQMQAMQMSVEGARLGYHNMDLAQRDKLWSIHDTTAKRYHAAQTPSSAGQSDAGTGGVLG